jgi:hypothetical protein
MPAHALSFDARRHRTACRIALRQMLYTDGMSPTLAAWREAYEPVLRPRLVCHREEQRNVTIPWRT